MTRIEAWLEEERSSSEIHRKLYFEETGSGAANRRCVDYVISGAKLPAPLERADLAVPALIFEVMRRGKPLHVRGPVSRTLLDNIHKFQDFWNYFFPDTYQTVDVTADSEVSGPPRYDGAVIPFSGGVDSTFTAWRHRNDRTEPGQRQIRLGFLIHGFDIPVANLEAFEIAEENARATLESIDIPLVTIRTNWKSDICRDWQMEYAAGVVSCAYNFAGSGGYGLFAASEDFKALPMPSSGHPLLAPMVSAHDFCIESDGLSVTRVEKLAAVSDWSAGVARLRVCWQGPITGTNCGRCEKCVRTQLNFLVTGKTPPQIFDRQARTIDIIGLYVRNKISRAFLEQIVAHAKSSGRTGTWLIALRFAIFRSKYLPRPLWTIRQHARRISWLRRLVKGIRARAGGK